MIRRLVLLIAAVLVLWLLLAIPARYLGSDAQAVYAAVAALLCLVPAVATMIWTSLAVDQKPENQLAAVLGGTGIRLFAVLLAAWGLHNSVPYFQEHSGFYIWLLVFYLFTLAVEMTLLLAGRPAHEASKSSAQPAGLSTSNLSAAQSSQSTPNTETV